MLAIKTWIFPGNVVQSRAIVRYLPGTKVEITHLHQSIRSAAVLILGLDKNLQNLFNLCLCFILPGTSLTMTDISPDLALIKPNTPSVKLTTWVFLSFGNILPSQLLIHTILKEDKQNHLPSLSINFCGFKLYQILTNLCYLDTNWGNLSPIS